MNHSIEADTQLDTVRIAILKLDPSGRRLAGILRDTHDQLYDGRKTGRYRPDQLRKLETKGFSALVEINFHREFKFEDGIALNCKIAGVDVDCKYSQKLFGWIIPPESLGYLCLLIRADDASSRWSMGLLRVTPERLNVGGNRDRKATLNQAGRDAIVWLFKHAPLPSNILLHLSREAVDKLMGLSTGQQRINEIFRIALGQIVSRVVVATLGQQSDYMKRVRSNGGARTALQSEGIVILGQYRSHAAIARTLGLPIPKDGDSISVRLARAAGPGPGIVQIDGKLWKVATAADPVERAPSLPKT